MNSNKTILRFAPDLYNDSETNETMMAIYNAQSSEIDICETEVQRVFLNNLVNYCNVEGIRRFEKIFNIQADEEVETLEYRKARIISKFTIQLPYTKIFLRKMLFEIFGKENVDIDINYNEYDINVGIENSDENTINQTFKNLRNEIVPANMGLTPIIYEPYIHRYIRKYYTHEQLQEFTHGDFKNG